MKNYIFFVLAVVMATPVKAFDYIGWGGAPMYDSNFFLISNYNNAVYLNSVALNESRISNSDTDGKVLQTPANNATKQTLAPPPSAAKSKWPKKLAKGLPKEQRKEWERVFTLSLNTYRKLEKNLSIPKNDIAGAIAAYIAGNYMAYYNNVELVSDSDFVSLANQMRSLLINIPEFKRAKKPAKRNLYELMAIGGMFMAIATLALQSQPNQAISDNLQLVAKDNLEQFFGTSIFNIEIVNGELVIRQ